MLPSFLQNIKHGNIGIGKIPQTKHKCPLASLISGYLSSKDEEGGAGGVR
jgi:hypothetical protein